MEHGMKYVMFHAKKKPQHIVPLTMCYKPLLVRDKLLGVPAFVKSVY